MHKLIVFGFLSLNLLIFNLASARGEFRKLSPSRAEACFLKLSSATEIQHHCISWVDDTIKLQVWQNSLAIEFGRLSRSQWQILTQTYTAWHNAKLLPPYRPQHNYALIDFMPPTLQALDRHRFYGQAQKMGGQPPLTNVQLVTNCWGTVYEVLRLARKPQVASPTLFTTAAEPMLKTLRGISAPTKDPKPGDILLLSHRHGDREYLDHVVLVIDRNLYFEKAGTGDEVPYRFVAAQTLTQIWNPAIFRYEVRRPLPNHNLSRPSDHFSLQQQPAFRLPQLSWERWRTHLSVVEALDEPPTFLWIQPLPPLQQRNGRFHLPPMAYRTNALWPTQR